MIRWKPLHDGQRTARYRDLTLSVDLTPSGRWHAAVKLDGACSECLGDFDDLHEAMAACERYATG